MKKNAGFILLLVETLEATMDQMEWQESGCKAEKVYDLAAKVRDTTYEAIKLLRESNCTASLNNGVLTLEDGSVIHLV
jgi:hypothetical protein